jgi:tRNA(fMet)-specific endonuclease VapC
MYILDTDHLSIMDRGGVGSQHLRNKLALVDVHQVATSIISYEEQMRGWLSYAAKAHTIEKQVRGYKELRRQLANFCAIPIVEFDEPAAEEFQKIKKLYPRLGTMDLKIAAVVLVNQAVLLTRNSSDFSQIAGLNIEDWS